MIRNLLIAASAAAVLATATASTASAKLHVDLNLGVGNYGYGYGYGQPYPYYPVVDSGYYNDDEDCGFVVKKIKKWNKWHTAYIVKHKKVWVCY